jgi:hypothetical protein
MAVFWVVADEATDYRIQTTRLHGATCRTTPIFKLAAVRTSHPTCTLLFQHELDRTETGDSKPARQHLISNPQYQI